MPSDRVIKNGIIYESLKPFLVASLNKCGTVPNKNPVKIINVVVG